MDPHRSWAEIEFGALEHNLRILRSFLDSGVQVVAVVKADAYGHGLREVAVAIDSRVDAFGVANLAEALEVVEAGARAPVLVLSPALPSERRAVAVNRFVPMISTEEEAEAYASLAAGGPPLPVHFVVDTGMGRIGLWEHEAARTLSRILRHKSLQVVALSSHLPVADEDPQYTDEQLGRFARQRADLFPLGVPATILNSAGALRWPHAAQGGDLVRLGLAVYGISPLADLQSRLQPALTWKTRVILVRSLGPGRSISYGRTFLTTKPMRVATLAVGYADGYQRHLSGQGTEVLIRGVRCPLLGRVTMDQVVVDVTRAGAVEPGEEVVLIGQQGAEQILATELAGKAGTIAWEIFTGITKRVARVYL